VGRAVNMAPGTENTIAAAVGAIILYGNWGKGKLRPHILAPIVDALHLPEQWRKVVEFCVFIALGTYIAVRITHPVNEFQAFSAGLGWTGFAANPQNGIKK
jgi:hypothetical protein